MIIAPLQIRTQLEIEKKRLHHEEQIKKRCTVLSIFVFFFEMSNNLVADIQRETFFDVWCDETRFWANYKSMEHFVKKNEEIYLLDLDQRVLQKGASRKRFKAMLEHVIADDSVMHHVRCWALRLLRNEYKVKHKEKWMAALESMNFEKAVTGIKTYLSPTLFFFDESITEDKNLLLLIQRPNVDIGILKNAFYDLWCNDETVFLFARILQSLLMYKSGMVHIIEHNGLDDRVLRKGPARKRFKAMLKDIAKNEQVDLYLRLWASFRLFHTFCSKERTSLSKNLLRQGFVIIE